MSDGTVGGEAAVTTGVRFTPRLRLEPIGPENARDLYLVHRDDAVWTWYEAEPPTLEEVEEWAATRGDAWRYQGVHKWIAYDRESGEVVGRGGLSRPPVDDDWGQLYAFLPDEPWVREAHPDPRPFIAHRHWLENGWALRGRFRGRGYATEIGRAGLEYAFDVLGVQAVVSIAIRHNLSSRAVMERLGMRPVGEIRSRGLVDGVAAVQPDAPYAATVMLEADWRRS
jgi:RimJ/RimL family protein N-acetyltransferase